MKDDTDYGVRFGRISATLPVKDINKAHGSCRRAPDFAAAPQGSRFQCRSPDGDDVDALHDVCQKAGLRIIKSLKDKDYGLRAFVFEDPDGNRIDVGQPI